jgi:hypothetical protein
MKLKQITKLLFVVFLAFTIGSCNEDTSTTTTSLDFSADAQIYSFSLKAKAYSAIDSVTYPVLAKTRFSIDQFRTHIYNPDSLPYKTSLKKFHATLAYASSTPSMVQLVYPNDSIVDWNSSDSIDFSTPSYPKFKITATNGTATKEYTVDIRIHQVDPDVLVWTEQSLKLPSTVSKQKTLQKDNIFYTFSIDTDNKFYLHKTTASLTSYEPKKAATGLTASDVVLGSITLFNGQFFAIDKSNKGYVSGDGIEWTPESNEVYSILGVLPDYTTAEDSLLVITKKDNKYYFAKSLDLKILKEVRELNNNEVNNMPVSDFSSTTSYDNTNLNRNILSITGGKNFSGTLVNNTWSFQVDDSNVFRLTYNQENMVFAAKAGLVSFLYDGYLYALTGKQLYKSSSFGSRWVAAPQKEMLDPSMVNAHSQSVIVDSDNYIWIFGGVSDSGSTPVLQIWKGRLNKLNPKK